MAAATECRYCEQPHEPQFLCEPAKRVLDALVERGQLYCASPPDMKRVMKLVTDMGTMAIRRARGAA